MAVISINGITIPHVKGGENQGFEEFADMGMTAGGLRRKDVLTIKRTWSYETNPILKADAVTILNSLRTAMFQDDVDPKDNTVVFVFVNIGNVPVFEAVVSSIPCFIFYILTSLDQPSSNVIPSTNPFA